MFTVSVLSIYVRGRGGGAVAVCANGTIGLLFYVCRIWREGRGKDGARVGGVGSGDWGGDSHVLRINPVTVFRYATA